MDTVRRRRVPRFLTAGELNTIRGKALVEAASKAEILSVFEHLDLMEIRLSDADEQDLLGTKGWRRWMGLPDA